VIGSVYIYICRDIYIYIHTHCSILFCVYDSLNLILLTCRISWKKTWVTRFLRWLWPSFKGGLPRFNRNPYVWCLTSWWSQPQGVAWLDFYTSRKWMAHSTSVTLQPRRSTTWAAKPSLSPLAGTSTVMTLLPLSASEIRCPVLTLTRNKRHAWENPLKNNLPKLLNHYKYVYIYVYISSNTYHEVIFL